MDINLILNPTLTPPFPIHEVVGHTIDRCIPYVRMRPLAIALNYGVNDVYTGRTSDNIYIYYPVDISTTVFSYSRAVQYHMILHGSGVIARVLLHGPRGYAVS